MSIRFSDNLLSVYVHREAELCSHRKLCPKTMILEQNGDAYPCDFYLHSDWKLGNVLRTRLCHGGCPHNRVWNEIDNTVEVYYFCHSYKQIYAYAHNRMQQLGDSVREDYDLVYLETS